MPKLEVPWSCQRLQKKLRFSAVQNFQLLQIVLYSPPQIYALGPFLTSSKKLNFLKLYLIVSLVQGRGFFMVLCQVSWLTSQQRKHLWEANVFPSSYPLRIITVLYYTTDQLFASDFQQLSEAMQNAKNVPNIVYTWIYWYIYSVYKKYSPLGCFPLLLLFINGIIENE